MGNAARFLGQFFSRPTTTGAIAPSSASLSREIVRDLDLEQAQAVLEYGPGTGVFTDRILEEIGQSTKFLAIEINPELAKIFRARHPQAVLLEDSVANVRAICDRAGIETVDCIVSGLPWAAFGRAMQTEFMDAMMRVLRPGGRFVTFAYVHGVWLPAGKRFEKLLPTYFSAVSKSPIVWMNLPPAFVYRCRR
jgi:phosphatidylethanolamine/phosphatidyl-N-methylethanolamine N-methyltransferase